MEKSLWACRIFSIQGISGQRHGSVLAVSRDNGSRLLFVRQDVEVDSVNDAGEGEGARVIADGRGAVLADVERVFEGEGHGDGFRDSRFGDLAIVDEQRGLSAFAGTTAIVGKTKHDGCGARRKWIASGNGGDATT